MPKGRAPRYRAQREIFAQALALGKSAAEAGRSAGYKGEANARRNAQRADVKARVAELKAPAVAKLQAEIEINLRWATERHLAVIDKANLSDVGPADYHRAVDAISKLHGLYAPEKREITGKGGPVLDLTKLTDEQLIVLEQIYAAAGIDISADAESGTAAPEEQAKPH